MEEEQDHKGGNTTITSESVYPVKHQDGNIKLEETDEARAEAAKKRAHN